MGRSGRGPPGVSTAAPAATAGVQNEGNASEPCSQAQTCRVRDRPGVRSEVRASVDFPGHHAGREGLGHPPLAQPPLCLHVTRAPVLVRDFRTRGRVTCAGQARDGRASQVLMCSLWGQGARPAGGGRGESPGRGTDVLNSNRKARGFTPTVLPEPETGSASSNTSCLLTARPDTPSESPSRGRAP